MALSSPGIGSGLDVNAIVNQLVALERRPIQQLQAQASGLQTRISAYARVRADLAGLQDAASRLLPAACSTPACGAHAASIPPTTTP